MSKFISGESRDQSTLFPESLEDYVSEDNTVRVIDVFIEELNLAELEFKGLTLKSTGRPKYHPATLLKLYLYRNLLLMKQPLTRYHFLHLFSKFFA